MKECKHHFLINTSVVLTSYPAQYACTCKYCGTIDYIYCFELLDKVKSDDYEIAEPCYPNW